MNSNHDSAPGDIDVAAILSPIVKAHSLPAMSGAILTSKGLVTSGAVGVRKAGTSVAVTVGDQFHIGSDTKAMTATLIGMLVDEGKLRWNMTLPEALPDLAGGIRAEYRTITIEQLMAHRAGLSSESWPHGKTFDDMYALHGTHRQQRTAYVAAVLKEAPAVAPGTTYLYSNRSFVIAGAIAERASDMEWEDLIRKRLFDPLGMKSAGFGAMGKPGTMDEPWQHQITAFGVQPVEPGPMRDNPPVIGPAGTVHVSVGDWAKFIQLHLRGEQGEDGLLKSATIKHLHTQPDGGPYGYGWIGTNREWGGGMVLTHAGSNTMNYAVVWIAPRKDFAVLVMTNEGGDSAAKACDEAASGLIMAYLRHTAAPQ